MAVSAKPFRSMRRTRDIDHSEWLAERRKGIGGSDASAIVGLNPWRSPLAVYVDKTGIGQPEETESEAMRLGTDLEAYVAGRFTEASGLRVRRENAILQSIEYPFMLANVDRMVIGEKSGLECKTTSPWNKHNWEEGDVPSTYYCQCQHYLAVTGYDTWYLAVLVLGKGFYWYRVDRNEDDIRALIEAESDFWHNHVEAGVMPEPDGSAAADEVIRVMFGEGDENKGIELSGYGDMLDRLDEINTLTQKLDIEKKMIQQKLQAAMGDATIANASGRVIRWAPVTTHRIDSKRLKSENLDLYNAYIKESTSRRFSIKEA